MTSSNILKMRALRDSFLATLTKNSARAQHAAGLGTA
jgi:hypothetical protein